MNRRELFVSTARAALAGQDKLNDAALSPGVIHSGQTLHESKPARLPADR